ncbi:hypothetical protein E3T28_15905 [Cryobacterium sinapicolor]|uniref:Uncharacterized protein n=1 Tax=Cryobacterium sinapicolor TaxID=1259236 RepID=A0ABY2IW54_9MICO|nr:hypothetical protein [Cryobacterium sinapicolor]TFC94039.1 hypothetical protein E3T28_15905 [Cryobacterium sinapicolor]
MEAKLMLEGVAMTNGELTPAQDEYFRMLERMDISEKFRRNIEITKDELRAENATLVRGVSRVQGFQPND